MSDLFVVPLTLAQANTVVARSHRHNKPVVGAKFAIGVVGQVGQLRGVAIAGRPIARAYDDGLTLEVTRLATDGCPNACSFLYGACRRLAFGMGYQRVITYSLTRESGASLRGAGWHCVAELAGRSDQAWQNRPGRTGQQVIGEDKYRWETINPHPLPFSHVLSLLLEEPHEQSSQYLFG